MGMFDTFRFQIPLQCAECGSNIHDTQSKSFEQLLEVFKPGDIVLSANIRHGIIEETCYCDACCDQGERKQTPVFLVIWHNVYAGAYPDEAKAANRLQSIDRIDMLGWIEKQQNQRELWHRRFRTLFNDMHSWHRYSTAEDKSEFLAHPFHVFSSTFMEHLDEKDPLSAILRQHEVPQEEEGGLFF